MKNSWHSNRNKEILQGVVIFHKVYGGIVWQTYYKNATETGKHMPVILLERTHVWVLG